MSLVNPGGPGLKDTASMGIYEGVFHFAKLVFCRCWSRIAVSQERNPFDAAIDISRNLSTVAFGRLHGTLKRIY